MRTALLLLLLAVPLLGAGIERRRDVGGGRDDDDRRGSAPMPSPAPAPAPAPAPMPRSEPGRVEIRRREAPPAAPAPATPAPAAPLPTAPVGRASPAPRLEPERGPVRVVPYQPPVPPSPAPQAAPHPGLSQAPLTRIERSNTVPRRHTWHGSGRHRYSHYYDGRAHWYGFNRGPRFYWSRWHDNYWWWYDQRFGRWNYWDDGYWWYRGPNVTYVYVNDEYRPFAGVPPPGEKTPPAETPASSATGASLQSSDGRRMVQIAGADGEAFLYDSGGAQPVFLKYLGRGADKVRFTGGSAGAPLQILVEFRDGKFALFDENGSPLSAPAPGAAPTPPPAPEAIPEPPGKAPGE